MGTEAQMNNDMSALSLEEGKRAAETNHEYGATSAHAIGSDSWQQVGLLLLTGFNCGYILSYSNLILVPLGWKWGIMCMVFMACYILYAQSVIAEFHFVDGQRFIRYKDLMGYLFGRKMYYVTWVMQYMTLLFINMGFIILAAKALKELNAVFSDSPMRLQIYIIIAGVAYFIFASFIPTMSAMRHWLVASLVITLTYIAVLLVILVKDGKSNKTKNYEITGSKEDMIFNAFGAISAIVFANAPGMIPELQSTLRQPEVKNMRKALLFQFTVGILLYYGVTIIGYWAYGSAVSVYLPEQMNAARWVKVFVNGAMFLQTIVSQHMFLAPIHENLDTKFLKLKESMFSKQNIQRRLFLRASLFTVNAFIAAAFPFIGDFINLIGSFSLIPLTFLFASMIFLKVKGKTATIKTKVWHWFNIVLFSLVTIVTTVTAIRMVIKDVQVYSFFADA